jgi:hypothetical protein
MAVEETECKERRDNISANISDKIDGVKDSHQLFRWILSTFLVLYFIVLGFSLQRIIVMESKIAQMSIQLTYYEKFIRYNFRDSLQDRQ